MSDISRDTRRTPHRLSFPFENRPLAPPPDRADGASGKAYHAARPFILGVASGDPTHESVVRSPVVATELVGTSISSDFAPEAIGAIQAALQHSSNGHIKFFDGVSGGYVRCDVDQERWRADFRAVATVLEPTSPLLTLASFEIRDGVPGGRQTARSGPHPPSPQDIAHDVRPGVREGFCRFRAAEFASLTSMQARRGPRPRMQATWLDARLPEQEQRHEWRAVVGSNHRPPA